VVLGNDNYECMVGLPFDPNPSANLASVGRKAFMVLIWS